MSTEKPTVLITGANRGIGLEFVRQWLERGAQVIATARHPESARELQALREHAGERLRILPLDVGDDESVRALARDLKGEPIHLLINNAGVGSWGGLQSFDPEVALQTFNTNALGPLRVTKALLANLEAAGFAKIVNLTSGMGSIADNTSGGSYAYRMSKAALNQATKSLSIDLRSKNIVAIVINPGHVQTDMGGANAPTPVQDSIAGMNRVIDGLTLENTGTFFNWRGNTYPW